MHCREILFTPRCSPRARELPRSLNFLVRRTVAEIRGVKLDQFSDFGLFSNTLRIGLRICGGPTLQRRVVLEWFYPVIRRNNFVGGTCAPPSALLVIVSVYL